MKLIRYGEPGIEKPGILDETGQIRSLAKLLKDIDGSVLSEDCLETIALKRLDNLPVIDAETRIVPCINDVENIVFVTANSDTDNPEFNAVSEPLLLGEADEIHLNLGDVVEISIGLVIGEGTMEKNATKKRMSIAGYCLCTKIGGAIIIGPWMVTRDQITSPSELKWSVDIHQKADGRTGNIQLPMASEELVEEVGKHQSLQSGNIVALRFETISDAKDLSEAEGRLCIRVEELGMQSPLIKS